MTQSDPSKPSHYMTPRARLDWAARLLDRDDTTQKPAEVQEAIGHSLVAIGEILTVLAVGSTSPVQRRDDLGVGR